MNTKKREMNFFKDFYIYRDLISIVELKRIINGNNYNETTGYMNVYLSHYYNN